MGLLEELGSRAGGQGILSIASAILLIYIFGRAITNVYFHPLSSYPGPRLAAATRLYYAYYATQGRLKDQIHQLHERYGDVVRIAPDELSYIDPRAWNDIYGHRIGKRELMKDPTFYASQSSGLGSIVSSDRSRHGLLRKQASHGFSERALRTQEHVIKGYADLLIARLEECAASGKETQNIVDWLNFFTFDVMGDLVFGQSFECLQNYGYHPWVKLIFDSVKAGAWVRSIKYWKFLAPLAPYIIPPSLRKRRAEQRQMAYEKAEFRKNIDDGRQDLISGYLLPDSEVTYQEYRSTVEVLIIAGSETTATLMSGLLFYLLKDPERMGKLQDEIRGAFSSADEIDFVSVNKLPYLLACLDEGLRIYPPVPDAFPRNTADQAEIICDRVVPPWTKVGINHWSAYHSTRHFKNPDDFIPERWLDDNAGYEDDVRGVWNPFMVGPRNCLGRNLAFVEMRHVIARLLWTFDLELDPRSENWNQQKAYTLWEKPPMFVKLIPHIHDHSQDANEGRLLPSRHSVEHSIG